MNDQGGPDAPGAFMGDIEGAGLARPGKVERHVLLTGPEVQVGVSALKILSDDLPDRQRGVFCIPESPMLAFIFKIPWKDCRIYMEFRARLI